MITRRCPWSTSTRSLPLSASGPAFPWANSKPKKWTACRFWRTNWDVASRDKPERCAVWRGRFDGRERDCAIPTGPWRPFCFADRPERVRSMKCRGCVRAERTECVFGLLLRFAERRLTSFFVRCLPPIIAIRQNGVVQDAGGNILRLGKGHDSHRYERVHGKAFRVALDGSTAWLHWLRAYSSCCCADLICFGAWACSVARLFHSFLLTPPPCVSYLLLLFWIAGIRWTTDGSRATLAALGGATRRNRKGARGCTQHFVTNHGGWNVDRR